MHRKTFAFPSAGLAAALLLSACGGGDGGGSGSTPAPTPSPTATPAPTPAPTPTPTSSSAFDTAEYRSSDWLVQDNALPAFEAGATGAGAILAVIDDGIDLSNPEFGGRIVAGSGSGSGSLNSHGTGVTLIAAGERNGIGLMGVAFEASILPYNAQRCSPDCFIIIDTAASYIDDAVSRGARVINLSVVGDFTRPSLVDAVRRATAAGVVVVIAAGNTGADSPNGFALDTAEGAGSKLVIIVGAHTASRQPSSATARAGTGAEWYLMAYSEGATSYSTPVVAGTVALLAGSFPALTGGQIVDAIYAGADDAGAPGRDPVFGNGILNIGQAYARARAMAGG